MMKDKPNIIFIVVDALRPENLSCSGYHKQTSPNIDALANAGVFFENCYACSPWTDPSFTTIFSGKYPVNHGIVHHGPKVTDKEEDNFYSSNITMFAEILKSNGYNTIGVDWLGRWHKTGFDYYWGDEEGKDVDTGIRVTANRLLKKLPASIHNPIFSIIRRGRMFLPDHEGGNFTKIAIEKMQVSKKNSDSPFFLFIHYWDAHTPFRIPKDYYKKFDTDQKQTKVEDVLNKISDEKWRDFSRKAVVGPMFKYVEEFNAAYDGAINYIDYQIGKIMQFVKDSGLEENTLIVVTGDHGAAIGKHIPFFDHHGLFEEVIRAPLIIKYGDRLPKKRIKQMIQHADIMPTLFELMQIDPPQHTFDGHSMLQTIRNGAEFGRRYSYITEASSERFAVFDGRHKFIFSKDVESGKCCFCNEIHEQNEKEVLYDIQEDPDETRNFIEQNKDVADNLKQELMKWLGGSKFFSHITH